AGSTPSILEQAFSIAFRARSADWSERAHRTTSPCRAAVAASPVAIAPLPTMPSRSCMGGQCIYLPVWLSGQCGRALRGCGQHAVQPADRRSGPAAGGRAAARRRGLLLVLVRVRAADRLALRQRLARPGARLAV